MTFRNSRRKPSWPIKTVIRNRVQPKLVMALGATALYSLLGSQAKVTRDRGRLLKAGAYTVLVTIHPCSLLRSLDRGAAERSQALVVKELGEIRKYIG